MLPRKSLIPLKSEFGRIKASAKLYDSPSFGLLVSYRSTGNPPQAAYIVSKKISLKSTVRHQVKRKLADAIQSFLPRLPKNVELVFLAKQKATAINKENLQDEIEQVLKRARLVTQ